jgi:hypothetical protein
LGDIIVVHSVELEYLEKRERSSREMAVTARTADVQQAHLQMADIFAARILALKHKE